MAQRMIHLLAYHCEDGMVVSINENHVDRDFLFEDAQAEWRALGEKGRAPAHKLDTFVPLNATHEEIRLLIDRVFHQVILKRVLKQIVEDL